jgi:LPXTG-motif cell wall-anchored protein
MYVFARVRRLRLPSLLVAVLLFLAAALVATDPASAAPHARGTSSSHATMPDQARSRISDHAAASSAAKHMTNPRASKGHGGTSGEPTSPQPISTADANSGGANGHCPGGPYCSTRDGSSSMNGNGGGKATGRPCAGCVGKADNKNPAGQMPDATDNNAGYECDTNHGIARGNPAHTACTPPSASVCVPTTVKPCGQGVKVPPSGVKVPPPGVKVPPGGQVRIPRPAVLPNTGAPAHLLWLAISGAASTLLGIALLRRRPFGDN